MERRALEVCEQEPLHRSGLIQPHGALLVVGRDGRIRYVSANCAAFLGRAADDWLGREAPTECRGLLAELGDTPGSCCQRVLAFPAAAPCDAIAQRMPSGDMVIEFLPHLPWDAPSGVASPHSFADAAALAASRQALVELVAAATGFTRTMFYAFLPDGDGEVVAETRDPAAYGSYLGLRFPASDIPRIARELYLKNPWRWIPDARAEPVAVLGVDPQPPDLTYSALRSVSPVHRVYLANMGVVASLSFPVVIHGQLAALVAAHSREARQLPVALLDALSVHVRDFAFAWAAFQSQERMRCLDTLDYRLAPLHTAWQRHGDLISAWPEMASVLIELAHADGATLCVGDRVAFHGVTLHGEALAACDAFLRANNLIVWQCESLTRAIPGLPLTEVAGLCALRLTRAETEVRLYLCRREWLHEVAWGGNPDKPVEYHDGTLGIAPRRSFEKWVEKRIGYCRPWENEVRLLLLRLRERVFAA